MTKLKLIVVVSAASIFYLRVEIPVRIAPADDTPVGQQSERQQPPKHVKSTEHDGKHHKSHGTQAHVSWGTVFLLLLDGPLLRFLLMERVLRGARAN